MTLRDKLLFWMTPAGLILVLPPFPLGFLAPVVLIPCFMLMEKMSIRSMMRLGYLGGLIWGAGTLYWIGWATLPGLFGALLVFALYFFIFCLIQSWFVQVWGRRAFWLAPFVWGFTEWFSAQGSLAFPWNALAYSQASYPVLIQTAAWVGTGGISFYLVLVNVVVYFLWQCREKMNRARILGASLVVLLLFPAIYGLIRIPADRKPKTPLTVAGIQGNIDPYKKWTASFIDSNITIYEALTHQAVDNSTDLVIWPETAIPGYLKHRYSYLKRIRQLVDSTGVPLLAGAPDYEWIRRGEARVFNSVFLIEPNRRAMQQYSKMHLVPFSERVPLVGKFPLLYRLTKKWIMDIGDFSPGDSTTVMKLSQPDELPFGTVICFDSVFPEHVRKIAARGARFLVVITNDGWFGRTSGPYQHAAMAVFRAVENGIPVVRVANTGVSCLIDAYGSVSHGTKLYQRDVIKGRIDIQNRTTIYAKWGHWLQHGCWVFTGMLMLLTGVQHRRRHR